MPPASSRKTPPTDARPREALHATLEALLLLALMFFALRGWHRSLRPLGSDFTVYYQAAGNALLGLDPGRVERWLYPPAAAVLLAPLAALPLPLASAVWQALGVAAIALTVLLLDRLVRESQPDAPRWLRWLPLLALLRLFDSNLSNGQMNALTLALLVASYSQLRRGHELRAGLLTALATVLKVLPGILLLYFLVRRRPRALLAGVGGVVLLGLVPTLLVLGPEGAQESLAQWRSRILEPAVRDPRALVTDGSWLPGQSLTAVALRLGTDAPATHLGEAGPKANLFHLDPGAVRTAAALLSLLHALLVLWLLLSRPPRADSELLAFGLLLTLPLIVAPLVHKAHMLWLLPAATALLMQRRPHSATILTVVGLLLIGASTPFLLGRAATTRLLSFNTVFFGCEALFLASALVLARAHDADSPRTAHT